MFPDGNCRPRRARMTAVIAAIAVLGGGCSQPAEPLVMHWPPARPHARGAAPRCWPWARSRCSVPTACPRCSRRGSTAPAPSSPTSCRTQNPSVAQDLAVYSRRYGLPPARVTHHQLRPPPGRHAQRREGRQWAQEGHRRCGDDARTWRPAPPWFTSRSPIRARLVMYDQALSWVVTHVRPERGELLLGHTGIRSGARQVPVRAAGRRPRRGHGRGRHRGHRGDRPRAAAQDADAFPCRAVASLGSAGYRCRRDLAACGRGPGTASARTPRVELRRLRAPAAPGPSAFFPRPAWQDPRPGHRGQPPRHRRCEHGRQQLLPGRGLPAGPAAPPAGAGRRAPAWPRPCSPAWSPTPPRSPGTGSGCSARHCTRCTAPRTGCSTSLRETTPIPGMPGWPARPGYDLPTGTGTIAAALPFVTALARAAS